MRNSIPLLRALAMVLALAAPRAFAQDVDAEPPPPPSPPLANPIDVAPAPLVHVDAPPEEPIPNRAAVFIGDDGGFDLQTIRAIRGLAINELRKRGLDVVDDVRTDGAVSPASAQRLMQQLRVSRGFSVQVQGRLGNRVPIEVEEIAPDRPTQIFSAALTATSLEECDVIVPRLVDAVLDRKTPEENARMSTVTRKESQPFRKKPGEVYWSLGLVIPTFRGDDSSGGPVGGSLGVFYEIENFNFGIEGLFSTSHGLGTGGVFFQGNWLPFDGEISPFLGGGIGYMGADSNGGLGVKVQVGVEALRLHRVRIIAGFETLIPLFSTSGTDFNDQGMQVQDSNRLVLPDFFIQFAF